MRRTALFALALVLASCGEAPDVERELFNRGAPLYIESASDAAALEARVVALIDGAKVRAWACFERLGSEKIANALLRARTRGVDVRVVSDVDRAADTGLTLLSEKLDTLPDKSPRLKLMGGPLNYSPGPNRTLTRDSTLNQITHTFVLVDDNQVVNVSEGLDGDNRLRWGFDARSTDLAKDFEDEFTQLFGGVSATTLTYFDGLLKSNTNNRVYYPMPGGVWELYFGPQERLMKRVIDEVYAARASVQIMTPLLSNTFLVDALRYKANVGGIVDVLVDEARLGEATSRFNQLQQALAQDGAHAELRVGNDLGVTIVVIDAERARDGRRYQTRVLVLSHPLVESIPFNANDESRPSDAFMDGNMWVLSRPSHDDSKEVSGALRAFARAFARGALP